MEKVPIPFKMKVVKSGNSLRMTIPKPIVDYLKINEGDTLEVTVQDSEMAVKKKWAHKIGKLSSFFMV